MQCSNDAYAELLPPAVGAIFRGSVALSLGVATPINVAGRPSSQLKSLWSFLEAHREGGRANEFWQRVSGRKSLGFLRVRRNVEEKRERMEGKREKKRTMRRGDEKVEALRDPPGVRCTRRGDGIDASCLLV